ncbi:MAG: hypothetical protein ABI042_17780 [Verrucomicrobiota bacterium]
MNPGIFFSAVFFFLVTILPSSAIELITKDFTGTQSASSSVSSQFFLGADGRLVVFASSGTNLVMNDTNGVRDVFVYDRSLRSNVWNTTHSRWIGSQPLLPEGSTPYHLTPDSRYLVFTSSATGFVSGVTFPSLVRHIGSGGSTTYQTIAGQVYVHDLWSNITAIASVSPDGLTAANEDSFGARISIDGKFVAFKSRATNLVAMPDSNGNESDIFCRDFVNGTTEAISLSPSSDQTLDNGIYDDQNEVRMSSNGRYFCFSTTATNVVAGRSNTNDVPLVYWRDRLAGTNLLVSDTLDGVFPRFGSASLLDMTPDGRYVCFTTYLTNIVVGVQDTNGNNDVFIRDMELGETWLVTRTTNNVAAGGNSGRFTGDGRYLLFSCATTAVVTGVTDGNGFGYDLFLHDVLTRTNAIITLSWNGNTSGSESPGGTARVSDNGRFVLFMSYATNLIAATTNRSSRFYVRDMEASRTLNALRLPPSGPGPGYADTSSNISADGRVLTFLSFTNVDYSITDTNNNVDLFAAPLYPPQFLAVMPSGEMSAEGISGATYVVDASTNLVNWTAVNTNIANSQGVLNTSDSQRGIMPHRFYRLNWK